MCMKPQAAKGKPAFRKSLRNAAINYRNGWFFVTSQVAHNKSIFGAIVGERCELNALGREVEKYWRELPTKYPALELLNRPRIAFVASQGFFASELRPRRVWAKEGGLKPAAPIQASGPGVAPAAPIQAATGDNAAVVSARSALAAETPALISTFTSAQEREALRRALAKGRPVIQALPQGIPPESELSPELRAALRDGRALLISPQTTGSRLNKKVATWCNEYVLRHADEIWVGDLSPNGMLSSMLYSMNRLYF